MSYIGYGIKTPCSVCGKFVSIGEPCDCNAKKTIKYRVLGPSVSETHNTGTSAVNTSATSMCRLEDLYNDLGTLKWLGSDDGWDRAIEAVRAEIKKRLE